MKVLRMPTVSKVKSGSEESTKVVSPVVGRRAALLGAATVTQIKLPSSSSTLSQPHSAAVALGIPGVVGSQIDRGIKAPVLTKPQTVLVGAGTGTIRGPAWLEGTWDVSPELVDVTFPLGKQFLRKNSPGVTKASIAEAADIGRSTPQDPVRQQMRWTVNENGEVVPDLLFNITSSMNALLGANANAKVRMQNSKRLSVTFATSRRNATLEDEVGLGQENDPRKLEIFLNYSNYKYENEGEYQSFRTDRLIRQVSQAKNQDMVGDYQISEVYQLVAEGQVNYLRFISAFVTPVDPAYFDIGDKAVAVYTFKGRMMKTKTETETEASTET